MHVMRLSVRWTRPPTRRSGRTHAQPSMAVASKTEIASNESIRGRALATVEYGSGLGRIGKRRAQGHGPLPDARTRARAFNAPAVFPPNTLVTGSVIGNRHPSHRSFLQPSPPNVPGRVRTRETRLERLIRTPSRHPGSALRISARYTASDPRPDRVPS